MRVAVTHGLKTKTDPYFAALRDAGLEPVSVNPDRPIDTLEGLAGLLLCGGSDVHPQMYRQPLNGAREVDRPRDVLEKRLLLEALGADLPILAICRGSQLMNVAHPNGTLHQDIAGHRRDDGPHHVTVERGTKLAEILGAGDVQVNSRHHQAVCDVGAGLVVSARAHDGIVEALERADRRFVVAVQWHPEDLFQTSEQHRRLFHAFAEALLPSAPRL